MYVNQKDKWGRKALAFLPQANCFRELAADRSVGRASSLGIGSLANHTTLVREEGPLTGHVWSVRVGDNRVRRDAAIIGWRTCRIRERVPALGRSGGAKQVVN
jgi:hypothetical protein